MKKDLPSVLLICRKRENVYNYEKRMQHAGEKMEEWGERKIWSSTMCLAKEDMITTGKMCARKSREKKRVGE